MPILILSGGAVGGRLSVPFTARTAVTGRVQATFTARTRASVGQLSLFATAQTLPSPPSVGGGLWQEWETNIQGLPGDVLDWTYTHSGTAEDLDVTVAGLHGLSTPSVTFSATGRLSDGRELGRIPTRGFRVMGAEPRVDVGADTTMFRFRNSFDALLRGVRLPELIPWKLDPRLEGECVTDATRRRVNIPALVGSTLRQFVDPAFMLAVADPIPGEEWLEGLDDISTEGMTPQELWDASFGALGMALYVWPRAAGIRLVGVWPEPVTAEQSGLTVPLDDQVTRVQARELLHTPTRFTVRGRDDVRELDHVDFLKLVGAGDPAYREVELEVTPTAEWYDPPEQAGDGIVQRGYNKLNGELNRTLELTTANVTVRETVDGVPFVREWAGVATGYKYTETTFDPACRGRPLSQRTVTKSWAFDAQTRGGTFLVTGPGLMRAVTVGDLAADEETFTTFTYSPQGWQNAKTTTTRRLASLKQANAEGPPAERGALEAREYVTTQQTERWFATGAGRFLYQPGVSGQSLFAVYDAESGEAVRTASVLRSAPDAPRLTDQAPPSFPCKPDCGVFVTLRDQTGIVFRPGDAGFAEPQEVSVSFLRPERLRDVGTLMLGLRWNRVVTEFTVPYPVPFFPGVTLRDGLVRSLRVSQSGAGPIDSALTVAQLDDLLLSPRSAGVDNYELDRRSGRALMLSGRPGGARARIVTGWNVVQGRALVEDGFIAFRTGFPPRPGEEIEWTAVNGVREARNAR